MIRRLTLLAAIVLAFGVGASALAEETATEQIAELSVSAEAPASGGAVELAVPSILDVVRPGMCSAVCGTYFALCREDCTEEGCYAIGCGYPNGWSQGTCSCSFCF